MDGRARDGVPDVVPNSVSSPEASPSVLSRRDLLRGAVLGGVALFHETFRPILLPTLRVPLVAGRYFTIDDDNRPVLVDASA